MPSEVDKSSELCLKLLLTFVEALQPQLPAMELDAELIYVDGNLRPLRFVFLQLMPKIGDPNAVRGIRTRRWAGHLGRLTATLAINCHPGGSRIDHKRSRTIRTGEQNVLVGRQ